MWGGGGWGRGTANKGVHFVVTKRTADDFSLLSYTLLSWDCTCLLVQYSIWSEKQIMEAFFFTNSTLWAGTNKSCIYYELDFSLH